MISKETLVLAELNIWKQRHRFLSVGLKLNWNEQMYVQFWTRQTFYILAQFSFIASKMEPDYYYQKVNTRVTERLKT